MTTVHRLSQSTLSEPGQHPLVGFAFLSYSTIDDKISLEWQGTIRAVMASNSAEGDLALVDFFEWVMGDYSYSQLVPLREFAQPFRSRRFFKLFRTETERNNYYEARHGKFDAMED